MGGDNLFAALEPEAPLADRMRPRSLDEVRGQDHLTAPDAPFRKLIENDRAPSMIFWGPPGSGKTTLARLVAESTKSRFVAFSAVTSGVKEVREIVARARGDRQNGRRTTLFVDEIHRFNRAQQDAFLPHVEDGTISLIGATTENPSFEVNAALLSRTQVFVLNLLDVPAICEILNAALAADGRGLPDLGADADALEAIAAASEGDARRALNVLETVAASLESGVEGDCRVRQGGVGRQSVALRQERRRTLQPYFGASQEPEGQRSACFAVLAGADVGIGRTSALYPPAYGPVCV